jgi:hypothetical protein
MYLYCGNSPINNIDPSGKWFISIIDRLKDVVRQVFTTLRAKQKASVSRVLLTKSKSLPTKGKPNSEKELLNSDGTVKQKRYYDSDGKAERDVDYNHQDNGTHEFPHQHDWNWDGNKPSRRKT